MCYYSFMKRKLSALLVSSFLLLSACNGQYKTYYASDYILELPYQENFRVLQLTDLHIADKDDQDLHFDFLDITINESNPNLIVVTGDVFTFASKGTARRLCDYLDSHDVPWTVVFGNHDEQCLFSIEWFSTYLTKYGSNCIFKDMPNDDVYGNCNFVINLMKNNATHEQIILMDTNRYNYNGGFGYDHVKQNQIDWYEKMVNYSTSQNNGVIIPSTLYYHIPLPEINEAWEKAQTGQDGATLDYGEKREKSYPPTYNSGLFDKIVELGSTRAMFFGHDHLNNFRVTYKGVTFGYGIKSTDRIYYADDLMGGRTMIIHDDHSLTYEEHYHTYDEVN